MTFNVQLTDRQFGLLLGALNRQVELLGTVAVDSDIMLSRWSALLAGVSQTAEDVADLRSRVRAINFRLFWQPQVLGVNVLSQYEENGMAKFKFNLNLKVSDPVDGVVKRTLHYAIGLVAGELDADPNAATSADFVGGEAELVTVKVVDEDQAGNPAESDVFSWTVVDQIPPKQPGVISVNELEQVGDDVPSGPA